MPKITIQVEQFTRRDGTVVRAHERELDVPSLSGENRVKLDDFIQSIGIGTSSFNPVDTASEVSTLESIISDAITEKTASSSESERLSLNEEEIDDLLDSLIGNELEEDQLNIPQFNEDTDNFIFQIGTDAYLHVRNREELPSSGPFEITITDVNDEHIGYMRGTKGGDEISFNLVHLNEDSRGFGIGKSIYQEFLNRGNTILSDTEITEGTASLYKSLNRDGVDIFDKDGRALLKLKPEKIKDPTLIEASAADRLVDIQGTGGALSSLLSSGEKTTVYRGTGDNFSGNTNDAFLWVALDRGTARNYADSDENVEELSVSLPQKPFDFPFRTNVDVRSSDIGNIMRDRLRQALDDGSVKESDLSRIFSEIRDYESAAGDELEPYHTKVSKHGANKAFKTAIQSMGFDGIFIEEGEGTYALFDTKDNQDTATFDSIVNAIAEDSGFTQQQVGEFLRDAGVQKNDLPADSEFLGTVPIGGFAPDSENFKRWSRGYRLHGDQDFLAADGRTGEPFVVEAYHGTTHDFYQFNAGEEGEITGFLGSQNYFTTSYSDASQNYGAAGGDLTSRIERRTDEVESDIGEDSLSQEILDRYGIGAQELNGTLYDGFTEEEFIQQASPREFAEIVADRELSGDNEQVMDLYIRADNPIFLSAFRIDGNFDGYDVKPDGDYAKNEFIDVGLEFDEDELNDAWEEVKRNNDLTDEDREDWQWDIEAKAKEWSYSEPPLVEALDNALRQNGYDTDKVYEILGDAAYESEISTDNLNEIRVRMSNELAVGNDFGEFASSEVFAQTLFNLGYDAIILRNSDVQFPGLTSEYGTSHIHLPDNHNNQIKLRDGRNTNFAESPDIRDRTESNAPSFRDWLSQENKTAFVGKSLKEILRSPEGRAAMEDYKRVWRRNLP